MALLSGLKTDNELSLSEQHYTPQHLTSNRGQFELREHKNICSMPKSSVELCSSPKVLPNQSDLPLTGTGLGLSNKRAKLVHSSANFIHLRVSFPVLGYELAETPVIMRSVHDYRSIFSNAILRQVLNHLSYVSEAYTTCIREHQTTGNLQAIMRARGVPYYDSNSVELLCFLDKKTEKLNIYLKLSHGKEQSSVYSKGDIWILSSTPQFDGENFVLQSVYHGFSSAVGKYFILDISYYLLIRG